MKEPLLFGPLIAAPEPSARRHPSSFALNIFEELEHLQATAGWARGASHKTLTRHADFRVDLFAIRGGTTIAGHTHPGRIVVQCVEGWIRMNSGAGAFDLSSGEILMLEPGVWHDVEARCDSAFLLTISIPHSEIGSRIDRNQFVFPPLQVSLEPPPAAAPRAERSRSALSRTNGNCMESKVILEVNGHA